MVDGMENILRMLDADGDSVRVYADGYAVWLGAENGDTGEGIDTVWSPDHARRIAWHILRLADELDPQTEADESVDLPDAGCCPSVANLTPGGKFQWVQARQQWEYLRTVPLAPGDKSQSISHLGSQGWEMIGQFGNLLYWKRPVV